MQAADEHGPKGIVGEFLLQFTEQVDGFFVLLFAVAGKILGQIKLRFRPRQLALFRAEPELSQPFGAASARKSNKHAQEFDDGGKGVDKIVVDAEAQISIRERGIELERLEE